MACACENNSKIKNRWESQSYAEVSDYMFNKYFSESFAVGVQGFVYQQVTGDSGSGAALGSFKGQAAGTGLAAMWAVDLGEKEKVSDLVVTAKWLHEYHARNRLKGDYVVLNLTLGF
jgi:hypothetical protein